MLDLLLHWRERKGGINKCAEGNYQLRFHLIDVKAKGKRGFLAGSLPHYMLCIATTTTTTRC